MGESGLADRNGLVSIEEMEVGSLSDEEGGGLGVWCRKVVRRWELCI